MNKIKRKTPCHCINLRRVNAVVTDYYDRILKPLGLTVSQYSLLVNLSRVEPAGISRLAGQVGLERTTLTRSLKPLFSAGLIEDLARPGRRERQLGLSASGRGVVERGQVLWQGAQKGIERHLGVERLNDFLEILSELETIAAPEVPASGT